MGSIPQSDEGFLGVREPTLSSGAASHTNVAHADADEPCDVGGILSREADTKSLHAGGKGPWGALTVADPARVAWLCRWTTPHRAALLAFSDFPVFGSVVSPVAFGLSANATSS